MNQQKAQQLLDRNFIDSHDNWKMLCPFHDESSPSFFIHKTDLICNCFGCGVSGSIEGIIWRLRGLPPSEVRKVLEIDRMPGQRQATAEPRPTYFSESWLGPWRRISGSSYLQKRGFEEKTIETFEARLDPAAKRIVFPLRTFHTHSTTLVGAAGRSYVDADPKWKFYWHCQKSKNVFKAPPVTTFDIHDLYVVEGIFDVMWLWQHGYRAVALLGSKPSHEQIKQIKLMSDKVIIALDNDQAGHEGGQILEEQLKFSCDIMYTELPQFFNDVCDLDGDELHKVLQNPITPLEKKLNVNSY